MDDVKYGCRFARAMNLLENIHGRTIHGRRVRVLADVFARNLPTGAAVLDVGTGDGTLAALISQRVEGLNIKGVEVSPRADCAIEVEKFDGVSLPFEDNSFDVVLFSDVLHHVTDPMVLLAEARRVARSKLVIKDHLLKGFLAGPTLRFMDKVGNARFKVPVPGNYWSASQWQKAFEELGLAEETRETRLGLYSWYLDWWFGRSLHFVASLRVEKREGRT